MTQALNDPKVTVFAQNSHITITVEVCVLLCVVMFELLKF